jgi:hypothetical protein
MRQKLVAHLQCANHLGNCNQRLRLAKAALPLATFFLHLQCKRGSLKSPLKPGKGEFKMPETLLSKEEKSKVWANLENIVGHLKTPEPRKQDWRVSNDNLSIFVKFSKCYNETDGLYWYGLKEGELQTGIDYKNAFIIFIT